ncbi:MAG: hypothetical protein WAO21_00510 [Verrucomicrobiia bacterium]
MMLRLYGDESGTNDITGQQPGSAVPALAGLIDTPEYWLEFCIKWKRILDSYRAPFFHFREFASKHLCSKPSSPYYGWSEKKRHGFLYDLAIQTSESAIPIGGAYPAKRNYNLGLPGNAFEIAIVNFYESCLFELDLHWPKYDGKVLFVLDHCDDDRWVVPLHKVHANYSAKDSRIGGLTFEDDKDPLHLPLQAADLTSYIFRQYAESFVNNEGKEAPPLRVLDLIINRNLEIGLRQTNMATWDKIIRLICEDEKRQMAIWKKEGKQNQKYYPDKHFPFEKYGFNPPTRNAI